MTDPNEVIPVNPADAKPTFVEWYLLHERKLVAVAEHLGHKQLEIIGFEKYPAGNWTHKKLLKAENGPIARYWLSLRSIGRSKHLRVPRFNLECGEELGAAFKEATKEVQWR